MVLRVKQLREESAGRLREMLAETKEKMFKYRLRIASGEGANPHESRGMRREVARIETILSAIRIVAARAGVAEDAARASLDGNKWNLDRAVAAARAGAPARA